MSPGAKDVSGEDRLIAEYFRPLARHPGALDLRDDAAVFTPPEGMDVVLTKDALVGGVHFLPGDPPDLIARKALRVNLSDLAAKGAAPAGFLLALALPGGIDADWLRGFSRGLDADVEHYGCALFGGDTVRTSGPVTISVTAFGTLPRGSMVHRRGARPQDRVFVSGTVGDAALGLAVHSGTARAEAWRLSKEDGEQLVGRYLLPQPRAALADAVRAYATAAMDVSDGLVGDLGKLCRESGIEAHIDAMRIPLSRGARTAIGAEPVLIETALTGGDDYEILCTVTPDKAEAFVSAAIAAGVAVTEIGEVLAGEGEPRFIDAGGRIMKFRQGSFSHF